MAWTRQQTEDHRRRFPWSFGANYYPRTAVNQLEMWQEATFAPEVIDEELGWAADIGMGLMRVYLHDLLHRDDAEGLFRRMERYLAIADRHGIATLFVFFDDCWNADFASGPQPAPKPGVHNSGWINSPGPDVVADPSAWGRLERYVKAVIRRFGQDERIFGWDLYNEPGAGGVPPGDNTNPSRPLPLLREVFAWAREADPVQPLTAGLWRMDDESFAALNAFQAAASDLLSFHCYLPGAEFGRMIGRMEALAAGRRVVCTEYMARTENNTVVEMLPQLEAAGIDAINWGLVAGKAQTFFPWGWSVEKGEPARWFHDLFRPDGSLRYAEEEAFFRARLDNKAAPDHAAKTEREKRTPARRPRLRAPEPVS